MLKTAYNIAMSEFNPFYTADGSVGLYNAEFDDIYHSVQGALTESYEKFIIPSNLDSIIFNNDCINVLDICYGIGYNTKAFLSYIKNIFEKVNCTNNYDSIYTDNQLINGDPKDNESIYTDNNFTGISEDYVKFDEKKFRAENNFKTKNFPKIYINAIDTDGLLVGLSPFIKTGNLDISNENVDFNIKRYKKYFENSQTIKPVISNLINSILLVRILSENSEMYRNFDIDKYVFNEAYSSFYEHDIINFYSFLLSNCDISNVTNDKLLNLHNIYYQYIPQRYKTNFKRYLQKDFKIDINIDDARRIILNDDKKYNLIFLDAFTPSKCPCLWSYEFFKELYHLLKDDGMLLTYSMSASVRSAIVEAGFCVGNVYNNRLDKFTGTVATKKIELINYPLSESDFGLLKTRAGIFYRDENLDAKNDDIITCRNFEVENSNKISSSKYLKQNSK